MIITVTSFKGGVGKTTTAIHLASYLQQNKGNVLLVDGDPNRSCLGWAKHGNLPFKVVDERAAPKFFQRHKHIVIDTAARPEREELEALSEGCDLLILPTTPDCLSINALSLTINTLKDLGTQNYKILLTIVPPRPVKDGNEAREMLTKEKLPLFQTNIRRMIAFQRAALLGVPIYQVKDKRAINGWNDYVSVGKEILTNE
jgi:chromosome partitioning protein